MNKVILIGNLTRDPELSQTPSGISLCKFCIAVSRQYTDSNGDREVDFINIIAWRGQAENCANYLRKGSKVGVVGSLNIRNYEHDGVKKIAADVVAENVEFLNKVEDSGNIKTSDKPKTEQISKNQTPVEDDELPF